MDEVGSQGYDTGNGEGQQQGTGINPVWNEALSLVPQELHSQLTPVFQKWDSESNKRFEKVQSEFEPWQPILKTGVDPQTAQFGLNLINAIESDPYTVYSALRDHYGKTDPRFTEVATSSNNGQGQSEPPDNDPYQSKIAQLERNSQIMAQHLVKQREAELAAQQDAQLDAELNAAKQKYGNFDERYVLALMQNGMNAEQAVQQFQQFVTNEAKKYAPKPLIMGTGSGIPNQGLDVKKLDEKGRKNLAVQMLTAMNAQDND